MKVIDLLNKIANGEEVPKKIKYIKLIWEYDKEIKDYLSNDLWLFYTMNSIGLLETEVEIIEDTPKEDKRIEKLDLSDWWEITSSEDCKPEMLAKIFNKNAKAFSSKINEIIDRINGGNNE